MSIRDEMVKCPFDEHHRVSRARFPLHLIKCRKQHKGKNFSICPYNATHYVLTPEFQFHLENCPDRKERDATAPVPDDTFTPPKNDIKVPPPSENWDNDGENVISYLDVKDSLISKLPVLRTPAGMTKSEKKRFMRREVHRFHTLARLNNQSASHQPTASNGRSAEASGSAYMNQPDSIDDPMPDVTDDGEGEFYVVKRRGNYKRADHK